jgi:hypothetical protein
MQHRPLSAERPSDLARTVVFEARRRDGLERSETAEHPRGRHARRYSTDLRWRSYRIGAPMTEIDEKGASLRSTLKAMREELGADT